MAKPISFGKFNFTTKKACEEDARIRINSYLPGSIMASDDRVFFEGLFTLHDEYDEKVGCGIKNIEVGLDFHRNRCLFIIRNDNSRCIISWRHCIKPYTKKMVVSHAFRRAVKNTVMEFKNDAISKGTICPKLGISLTFDNSHVSYTSISFDVMLTDFLTENHLSYESIQLIDPKCTDSDQRGIIANDDVMLSWQKYHQSKADMELLSIHANLSK